jgi:hypothetical protein
MTGRGSQTSFVASRRTWALLLVAALAAAPLALLLAADEAPPAGNPPHPVVGTHELMELFGEPLYDFLKAEVDKTETRDAKGWNALRDRGLQTAEVANLIALRQQEENRAKWIEHCAAMQQAGLKLAEVAKAKNTEQIRPAYLGIIQSCNACHKDFDPDHAPEIEP